MLKYLATHLHYSYSRLIYIPLYTSRIRQVNFKGSLSALNPEFSFSKAKETSMSNSLFIAEENIGFSPFPSIFALWEM